MSAPVFGPYRLIGVIAESGTATVHRATDTRLDDRVVALKVFHQHLSGNPEFQARLRRDAALLGTVRQPHVVPIHSYGVQDGLAYLDMRLIEGSTLAEARRRGALDTRRARAVAAQLGAAIEELRAAGFGPRRIAPEEVLLSGPAGREFVHVVGLGLGRPPAPAWPDPTSVVGIPAVPSRWRRRRRTGAMAAGVLTAVGAVIAVVALLSGGIRTLPAAPAAPLAPGQLTAVAAGSSVGAAAISVQDGRPVLVGALQDGIGSWDLGTGEEVAPRIPVGNAKAVATAVVDGDAVVVSRGPDQLVRVHRLADAEELGPAIGTAEPPARPGDFGGLPRGVATIDVDGRPVVAAVQPSGTDPPTEQVRDLGVAMWALPSGTQVGRPVVPGRTFHLDVRTATLDGIPLVLALGIDEQIQAFHAGTGGRFGKPITPGGPVNAFTVVDAPAGPVVVTGGADNTVRAYDLRTGATVGPTRVGHTRPVVRLATVAVGGRTVIVSGAFDPGGSESEVRFWDLETGAPVGPVLPGHPIAGGLLAAAEVDGRPVLISATPDGAAVWDVDALIAGGPS